MRKSFIVITLAVSAFAAFGREVRLATSQASCVVETLGARVLSFKTGGQELFWSPEPVQKTAADWAHGGCPIAWPWFGLNGRCQIHGTAWKNEFRVVSQKETPAKSELVLEYREGDIVLEYTLTLKDDLRLAMATVNASAVPFTFSAGFHPYFLVGERDRCRVSGFTPEPLAVDHAFDDYFKAPKGSFGCYRLADEALDRTIVIFADNAPGINLWNCGSEKDCPGFMPGDEWRHYISVEPYIDSASPVTVAPGSRHVMKMGVSVRKGAKLSGSVCNGDNGHLTMSPIPRPLRQDLVVDGDGVINMVADNLSKREREYLSGIPGFRWSAKEGRK